MMEERLIKFFGRNIQKEERVYYYDYIENYISENVSDWNKAPDTDTLAIDFAQRIGNLATPEFSFLLMTTGYLPEFYTHDSSQETLYSKLVEVLVCEWAKRIGFTDSKIQKQKSSKEDVTISIGNTVIVCDAKTFRLGRSQAAPNVKDTIKKADYDKWKVFYGDKEYKKDILFAPIGGLITFPSLHRWKKASDVILYCTDKDDPILLIFYEYMTYILIKSIPHTVIIQTLTHYGELFQNKTKNQHEYFTSIVNRIFGENNEDFTDFLKLSLEVINELVAHKKDLVINFIDETSKEITEEIHQIPDDQVANIKKQLIDLRIQMMSNQLSKQLVNIDKFRVKKGGAPKKKDATEEATSQELFEEIDESEESSDE